MAKEQGQKMVAQNKKARHDYHIEDTWEAGLVLMGTEVKSLRQGRASLVDGFAEIDKIERKITDKGYTIVPLALYFKDGRAKVEIALAKGKKSYDKRQDMAARDAQREVAREIGRRAKGRH